MFTESPFQPGMTMNWPESIWHWAISFHGILTILFLTILVVGSIALIRDLRGDRRPSRRVRKFRATDGGEEGLPQ